MEPLLIIFGIIFLGIIIRLIAGSMDHERVDEYVSEHGGKVLEKNWDPFGRGWFGDKNNRIYQVKYKDADGNIHQATCKTSLMSGVYLTEDEILKHSSSPESLRTVDKLLDENERLKQEIEELKKKQERQL